MKAITATARIMSISSVAELSCRTQLPNSVAKARRYHLVLQPCGIAGALKHELLLLFHDQPVLRIGQHSEELQLRHLVADRRALDLDTRLQLQDALLVLRHIDLLHQA